MYLEITVFLKKNQKYIELELIWTQIDIFSALFILKKIIPANINTDTDRSVKVSSADFYRPKSADISSLRWEIGCVSNLVQIQIKICIKWIWMWFSKWTVALGKVCSLLSIRFTYCCLTNHFRLSCSPSDYLTPPLLIVHIAFWGYLCWLCCVLCMKSLSEYTAVQDSSERWCYVWFLRQFQDSSCTTISFWIS